MSASLVCLSVFFISVAWYGPAPARAGSGFYLSGELGVNFAPRVDFAGRSNDRPSVCDEYINPLYASVPGCTSVGRGSNTYWQDVFDATEGMLAGAGMGYRLYERYPNRLWGRFRLELEYFYRDSEYDQTTPVSNAAGDNFQKLEGEILTAEERLGSLTSHNLFGNLYFDFVNTSRFTPYIGFGVGVGFTEADWGSLWARNPDPSKIATGRGLPNADEIRRNLAGTASRSQTELEDTLFGYQVLFGMDFALTETLSVGVKGRWVNLDAFQDSHIWDPLRSHPPNLRHDSSEPVRGWAKTNDTEMFGVSLSLKYHF